VTPSSVQLTARTGGWLLALLTLAGAAIRAWPVATRPLWHDEVMTWTAVQTGVFRILTWTHHYEHPPLSYLLVWISSGLLRTDAEWALRLPSLLAGVALIPAVYLLGRMIAGPAVGLIAAAIVTFDYNQIIQSQQARMYTLTALATTLTLAGVLWAIRGRAWWRWTLPGVGLAAAFASSHMGAFLWVAMPIGMAIAVWAARGSGSGAVETGGGRRVVARGVAVAFATAVAIDAIGFYIMARRIGWFRDKSGDVPITDRFAGLWLDLWHAYGGAAPAIVVLSLGVAGLVVLWRGHRVAASVLLTLLVVNALLVLPIMPHGFEPRPRYVIVGQLPLALGAAFLAIAVRPEALRAAVAVALVLAMSWSTVRSFAHGDHWRYAFGDVARQLAEDHPGDQVVFYPAWVEAVPWYYGLTATHTAAPDEAGGWGGRSTLADAPLPFDAIDPDRPILLVATYLHTGARDWVGHKAGELVDRLGVAIDVAAIDAVAAGHAIVVVRITGDAVTVEGIGRPEP
jgi:mannosyltransferase